MTSNHQLIAPSKDSTGLTATCQQPEVASPGISSRMISSVQAKMSITNMAGRYNFKSTPPGKVNPTETELGGGGYRTERERFEELLDFAFGLIGLEDRECVSTSRLQSGGPINPRRACI